MPETSKIKPDMEVFSLDGLHVGVVDEVEGNILKLKKSDSVAEGKHHRIPLIWVGDVRENSVRLARTREEVFSQWQTDQIAATGATNE